MIVAWRSGSQQGVSKMGTMALGGIFLNTATPPSVGSVLDLIFEVSTGAGVRARAMVCTSMAGQGMGVKFVHMQPEDRSRLNQFLKLQIEAGNIEEDLRTEDGQPKRARKVAQEAASSVSDGSSRWEMIFAPGRNRGSTILVEAPFLRPHVREGQKTFHHQESIRARVAAGQVQPVVDETIVFEEELKRYVVISEKSTYYGLLGIAGDCDKAGIRQTFYALARKFHPDRHMHRPKCAGALQQLMGAITEAYSVLSHEERRASYDRTLAQSYMQTEEEENIDHYFRLATNCRRGGNVTGAIFWFRRCVILAPEAAKYHASLATSLATLNHFRREAVEHFQKAIELDQWNPLAYLQLGELYEAMQLPWRAVPLYSKLLEIDPSHDVARQRLQAIDHKANKKARLATESFFHRKR
jgi:tetratricopeptide (TPR) repeat protein